MTITAIRVPTVLTAAHFVGHGTVIDPRDGTEQLAFTEYHVDVPDNPTRTVDGKKALAETFQIKITPRAKIKSGTTLTNALREHEQFHFDLGFVIARRVASLLNDLRADSVAELKQKFDDIIHLHFRTRNDLIQRRYDLDTRHGTQAHYERLWHDRMKACIGDPKATQLGGFYL
jgi:Bacterial protein of unknown function (DUF922)